MKNLFSPLGKRSRASRVNGRAGKLRDAGKKAEAIAAYQSAMAIDPTWSVPFYNLGLLHKYAAEWQASLDATLRATELDPKDKAGWWNLGIAATALGQWDIARDAWQHVGLKLPSGSGPVDLPSGLTPIRLDPGGDGETVWAERLDPARARVASIPLGSFCYGDVVLNDGAPKGYRLLRGKEVPVFDCLALLEPSLLSTWSVEIELNEAEHHRAAAFESLSQLALARGQFAENWSDNVRALCSACSEGRPHELHDGGAAPKLSRGGEKPSPQRMAIAARTKHEVHDLLMDWDAPGRGAELGRIKMEFSHA